MKVLLCGRVNRIEAQHGLELDNRFTQPILLGQGHPQVEVCLRILRIQPSRFLKTTGRRRQITTFGQGHTQVEMGFSERRVEPDRPEQARVHAGTQGAAQRDRALRLRLVRPVAFVGPANSWRGAHPRQQVVKTER